MSGSRHDAVNAFDNGVSDTSGRWQQECSVAADLYICVSGAVAGRAGLGTYVVDLMRPAETLLHVSTCCSGPAAVDPLMQGFLFKDLDSAAY